MWEGILDRDIRERRSWVLSTILIAASLPDFSCRAIRTRPFEHVQSHFVTYLK